MRVHESDQRHALQTELFPVTGAWNIEKGVGNRKFFTLPSDRPFLLEGGGRLSEVTLAYETWGTLNEEASNAILVCHALTGDSHACGPLQQGHATVGWWDDLIGPGKSIDTDRFYVVCINILGGCQGSTGPASVNPQTNAPYGSTFPVVSLRDNVRAQAVLTDHLGIKKWKSVIGGSMGGMQVLEWSVMFPQRVASIVPIATASAASSQQIAFSSVQRSVIALDPNWRGGDYYDAKPGQGPHQGLALARELAQITYRTDEVFTEKFGRSSLDPLDTFQYWQRFDVEGYLDYHGAKLVQRFDANSYIAICKAMDLHDVGRGRGGIANAFERVTVPVLIMSITSDGLYPPIQQEVMRDILSWQGNDCEYFQIESPHGHDAFLLETAQISGVLHQFLEKVENSY